MRPRLTEHLPLREHAKELARHAAAQDLAAEEEVLGDGERRRDREVLVDGLDALLACVERAVEAHLVAVENDRSLVGDDRARERLD